MRRRCGHWSWSWRWSWSGSRRRPWFWSWAFRLRLGPRCRSRSRCRGWPRLRSGSRLRLRTWSRSIVLRLRDVTLVARLRRGPGLLIITWLGLLVIARFRLIPCRLVVGHTRAVVWSIGCAWAIRWIVFDWMDVRIVVSNAGGCGSDVRRRAGRLHERCSLGFAMVLVVGELRVLLGLLACRKLRGNRAIVALMHCGNFCRSWLNAQTSTATVVADPIGGLRAVVHVVYDHVTVVDVRYPRAHVVDGTVVIEVVVLPVASEIAEADIAKAIIDAAVEADVWAPISTVEAIMNAAPAPVGRRPEGAIVRRRNPFTRDPVVAVITPGPVAGSPEVVRIWSGWLVVFGQRWRCLF
jgi:hypothetical protein